MVGSDRLRGIELSGPGCDIGIARSIDDNARLDDAKARFSIDDDAFDLISSENHVGHQAVHQQFDAALKSQTLPDQLKKFGIIGTVLGEDREKKPIIRRK
jgi:hypothetical protein